MNTDYAKEAPRAVEGRRFAMPWWGVAALCIGVGILAWAVRQPFLQLSAPYGSPDGMEYVNIARHIAEGEGATISIKFHLVDARPVVRSVVGDRAAFYPLVVAGGLRLFPGTDDIMVARWVSLLVSSLAAVVCMLLFANIFGWPVGVAAGVLAAISPRLIISGVEPLSDGLFFLLCAAGLWLFCVRREGWAESGWAAFGCGAICALAQLTRPMGVLLLVAMGTGYLWEKRGRQIFWLVAGFMILMGPYFAVNWHESGSPFYSVFAYNYTIFDTREGTWLGLDREPMGAVEFIGRNAGRIGGLIVEKTRANAKVWWGEVGWLALLAVLWPKGWLGGRRKAVAMFAVFIFLFYSFSWAPPASGRYLLASFLLVMPFLLEAARRPRWPSIGRAGIVLLAGAVLFLGNSYVQRDRMLYARAKEGKKSAADYAIYHEAAKWLEAHAREDAVVATNNPWMVNYLSRRPAIICPVFSREEQLEPFLEQYRVEKIVLFARETDRRVEMLESEAGRRLAVLEKREPVGGLEVWCYGRRGG